MRRTNEQGNPPRASKPENQEKPPAKGQMFADYRCSLRALPAEGQTQADHTEALSSLAGNESFYPFTLIFENDSTARPVVGRPIEVAGWNVVKISMFLTRGNKSLA